MARYLLMQDGGFLLTQEGGRIVLEQSVAEVGLLLSRQASLGTVAPDDVVAFATTPLDKDAALDSGAIADANASIEC